jgi:general stress protein 26
MHTTVWSITSQLTKEIDLVNKTPQILFSFEYVKTCSNFFCVSGGMLIEHDKCSDGHGLLGKTKCLHR